MKIYFRNLRFLFLLTPSLRFFLWYFPSNDGVCISQNYNENNILILYSIYTMFRNLTISLSFLDKRILFTYYRHNAETTFTCYHFLLSFFWENKLYRHIIIYDYYTWTGGEDWLGFPDLSSGQKPWRNWYLTPVVNFGEDRRAQLTKSTLLTSSLVPLGSFQIF